MIRVAIVEDERKDAAILVNYLNRYKSEYGDDFTITTFSDGLDIVSDYTADYDIIFLDIQMKHLDGMKTAENIRKLDENVVFIFITSTVRFAVQGYMVDALGYVLKPVPYLAFSQLVSKAVKQVKARQSRDYLHLEIDSGFVRLEISQIYFIESQLHHIIVHSEKGDFLTAGPLKRVEQCLADKGFAKCHSAYLINLSHVNGCLQNRVILSENTELPISRSRKKAFLDNLTDYIGGNWL